MTTEDPPEVSSRPPKNGGDAYADPMSLRTCSETPEAPEGSAPPIPEETPVAAGGTFLTTKKATPRTSRSKTVRVERTIRTVIAYVLLLAILGAAGIAAVALVRGTWMVTPVLSGSMRPGLPVGGIVISQQVPVDSLHVRDVIIFLDPFKPSEQIVHRIVKITKGAGGKLLFNTQGDANLVRDPWTLSIKGDYIYRARWTVPLIGYVAIAYQNHTGFFLLGAGILLILIAVATLLEARQGRTRRHSRGAARVK